MFAPFSFDIHTVPATERLKLQYLYGASAIIRPECAVRVDLGPKLTALEGFMVRHRKRVADLRAADAVAHFRKFLEWPEWVMTKAPEEKRREWEMALMAVMKEGELD